MKEKSLTMSLIDMLKSQCKRQFIVIVVLVIGWAITIGGFIWYINQFDYSNESTATIETENNGNINTGDINNG